MECNEEYSPWAREDIERREGMRSGVRIWIYLLRHVWGSRPLRLGEAKEDERGGCHSCPPNVGIWTIRGGDEDPPREVAAGTSLSNVSRATWLKLIDDKLQADKGIPPNS
jgi:hypothetical protein